MLHKADKNKLRKKRHLRVRNRISGTPECPRLNVFRSLSNIYAQVIDDVHGVTLVAASSKDKDFNGYGGNVEAAKAVGAAVLSGFPGFTPLYMFKIYCQLLQKYL